MSLSQGYSWMKVQLAYKLPISCLYSNNVSNDVSNDNKTYT
jgi:hypothetical protein